MALDLNAIRYQLNELPKEELLALYRELIGYESELLDMNAFLDNTDYLGHYYGERTFPIWRTVLGEIFPNPYTSPWSEIIIEGGVGTGKSTCAIAGALYDLYKLLHLKNPHDVFGLTPSTSIVFHIFNATLTLADDVIWSQIHEILMNSPYFKEQLMRARRTKSDCLLPKRIKFEIGSRPSHALGTAVFEAILDEMNFQTIVSSQAYKNYNRLTSRQESRFMQYGGTLPGHTWLVSSADTPNSFLNLHKRNRAGNKYTKSYSFAIWEALSHKGIYSGRTFRVFVGDEYIEPRIVGDGERVEYAQEKILDVPIEYFDAFSTDIYVALRDKAGAATGKGTHKLFMSHSHVLQAMVLENYFNRDEIQLDFWDDQDQMIKYFRLQDYISNRSLPEQPRFLHIDTGLTGDRLGIACCYSNGYTEVERLDDTTMKPIKHRELKFQVEFAVTLKARPGQEIPLFKVRLFLIQELMKRGVKIGRVTADGFQSRDCLQLLNKAGIKAELLSMDRGVDNYVCFRNAVYERRCLLPRDSELLKKELIELQIVENKVDHELGGSKDLSDAVGGCVCNLLTYDKMSDEMVSQIASYIDTAQSNNLYEKVKRGILV